MKISSFFNQVLLMLFLTGVARGEVPFDSHQTFTVSVDFNDASINGQVLFFQASNPYELYYNGFDYLGNGARDTCAVANGQLKVSFFVDQKPSYFAMYFTELDAYKNNDMDFIHAVTNLQNSFMLSGNGSHENVHFDVTTEGTIITGSAGASIKWQYDAYRLTDSIFGTILVDMTNAIHPQMTDSILMPVGRYYDYLSSYYGIFNKMLESQLQALEKYRGGIPDQEFQTLKWDFISRNDFMQINDLYRKAVLFTPKHQVNVFSDIVRYYNDHFWFEKLDLSTDSLIKAESRIFYQYVLQKEVADLAIPMAANAVGLKPTFEQIMQKIVFNYSGRARELLLSYALFHYSDTYEIPNWAFSQVLGEVTDENLKTLIEQHVGPRVVGRDFLDFRLTDQEGNSVSNADFMGKVVVLDFWYTGCTGCAQLAKAIGPIVADFSDRDDVLFVSVSIDKDANQWKKSVAAGTYTHKESFNLYTSGAGANHPLITHYGIQSYPTLMIINKKGKLASVNPPRPSLHKDHPNNQKFVSLVEDLADGL